MRSSHDIDTQAYGNHSSNYGHCNHLQGVYAWIFDMSMPLIWRASKDLRNNRFIAIKSPEGRFKPQFKDGLDKDADVMTQNLTKNLINLSWPAPQKGVQL